MVHAGISELSMAHPLGDRIDPLKGSKHVAKAGRRRGLGRLCRRVHMAFLLFVTDYSLGLSFGYPI